MPIQCCQKGCRNSLHFCLPPKAFKSSNVRIPEKCCKIFRQLEKCLSIPYKKAISGIFEKTGVGFFYKIGKFINDNVLEIFRVEKN
jgi:hypothetical protein